MKFFFSNHIVLVVLVALIGSNILYAQNILTQPWASSWVSNWSTGFSATQSKEKNTSTTDTLYEVGTVLASFVDARSDWFSGFWAGSCTEYVARQRPELFVYEDGSRRMTGNAEDRLSNAKTHWFETGKTAKQGAIAVYYEGQGGRKYGHVAYVEHVQNNGNIIVSEMNYKQDYIVTWRVVKANRAAGYIY